MKDFLLQNVNNIEKPARYAGGEYNSVTKQNFVLRYCICFPDVYEVAMSNLGTQILYFMLNEQSEIYAERCYSVWEDMARLLSESGKPLFSLESKTPLKDFDMLGFSFQAELSYTNMLTMLSQAQVPLLSKDRTDEMPLVMAGGPCMVNPLPIKDFVDIVVIGDGEDALINLSKLYINLNKNKIEFLKQASNMDGVYVPKYHDINENGIVKKAVICDLNNTYMLDKAIVPNIEAVHNRAVLELFRGCARGCRFCQAGFIYRPVRFKSQERLADCAEKLICNTGFEELSLSSLSTGDFPNLLQFIGKIKPFINEKKVRLALPSLRMDSFDGQFADENRKSSLTFAPEAGTQRLRDVINKNISDSDFETAMINSFQKGYSKIKLYFMIGLPTETDEDILGIVKMAGRLRGLFKQYKTTGQPLSITVSTSVFIPKPWTPFQWCGQADSEQVERKQALLLTELRKLGVRYIYHDMATSVIESAFARGDERLNAVLLKAFESGCTFDGWTEYFSYEKWLTAFEECDVDINEYVGKYDINMRLAWDFIDIGVTKSFLVNEYEKAMRGEVTPSCDKKCSGCGVNKLVRCDYVGV